MQALFSNLTLFHKFLFTAAMKKINVNQDILAEIDMSDKKRNIGQRMRK
jgi:hypothetical protein